MGKDMTCKKNSEILGVTKEECIEESYRMQDWRIRYRLNLELLCMFILDIALLFQGIENPK